jgi:MYXO-CTERM domain-containing protein
MKDVASLLGAGALVLDGSLTVSASAQAMVATPVFGRGPILVGPNGRLISGNVDAVSITVEGRYDIRAGNGGGGTSRTGSLIIGANEAGFTGKLDLNDNTLLVITEPAVVGDKSAKLELLSSALAAGFHGGDWLGNGIASSTVAADASATGSHTTTLALYDNADLGLSVLGGFAADSNSLFIATALIADANFDGAVDAGDFAAWQARMMTYAFADSRGDFTHDGAVDGRDFDLWYGHAPGADAILDGLGLDAGALSALYLPPMAVPEPTAAAWLVLGAVGLWRRRRGNW